MKLRLPDDEMLKALQGQEFYDRNRF